jgi:hypothetical protein
VKVSISDFVNESNISVSEVLESDEVTKDGTGQTGVKYAYLGGVIGRVQSGMKLINCTNKISGEDVNGSMYYTSNATYLGGLAEINAGVVRGTGEKKANGDIKAEGYLTNSTSFTYSNKSIGAIVGINGTPLTRITYDSEGNPDDNSTGVLMYCKNSGDNVKVEATGETGTASGIVAATGGDSAICYCVSEGKVKAVKEAAGILGSVVDGSLNIWNCTNAGTIEGADLAAGIVGKDLASENLSVTDCMNKGLISSDNGKAAGIMCLDSSVWHSSTQENSVISGNVNYGDVDGKTSAAGILAESTSPYVKIDNSANVGLITISGKHPGGSNATGDTYSADSSLDAAGIVCDTSGNGVIRLCRNYGPGLYYGITKEPAESIHYCFDATNASTHIGPINTTENSANKYANFYRGADKNLEGDKKFTASMGYVNSDPSETVNMSNYVLSAGQSIDNIQHHCESGNALYKDSADNKLKYTIQPVYNFVDASKASVDMDELDIVWDNYDKIEIDEYMGTSTNKESNTLNQFKSKSIWFIQSPFKIYSYLDLAEHFVNKDNIGIGLDGLNWFRYNLGDVSVDSVYDGFRRNMGIPLDRNLLKQYTDTYNKNYFDSANSYESAKTDSTKYWDYFSNYAYATYIAMRNSGDTSADHYWELLYSNSFQYGLVEYQNANKDYTINYNVILYNNTDDNDPSNDLSVVIPNISSKMNKNDSDGCMTDKIKISDLSSSGRLKVSTDYSGDSIFTVDKGSLNVDKISKVEIVVNSCTVDGSSPAQNVNYVGIRTFEWKDGSNPESTLEIMPAHDGTEVNPYAGVHDVYSLLRVISDNNNSVVFESESEFYVKNTGGEKYQYTLYGYDTGIGNLDYSNGLLDNYDNNNSSNFGSYNSSYRKKVFEETDTKYVAFINNYLSGVDIGDAGVGFYDDSWDDGGALDNEDKAQNLNPDLEYDQADSVASPNDAYSQDE